ncbi:MAG: helix-turn-helix transcriptional regulator [Clostridia bacterium]|nr:helix-turn-helix transcriptional regulator [Clostridia bacterium]
MDATFIYHQQGKDSMYKVWHEFGNRVMFLYVIKANGNIVTHEKIRPLKKGALYFVGAKKSHYTVPDNIDQYVRDKLFLPVSRFEAIRTICDTNQRFKELFESDQLVYAQIPTQEQPQLEQIFLELKNHQDDERYSEAMLVSVCAKLFVYLDKYAMKNLPVSTSSNFVFKAIEYINQHITEALTVDEICTEVFISKYYFCRKFKETTGLSVMEYILSTRLSIAQEMLLNKKLTVSQISDRCGFSSLAYFCNVFKQKNGITPLQYRRQAHNSNFKDD